MGVVEFLEGSWVITNHKRRESINLWSELNELEVIGNKWQNPELLEGVK
ncbi:YopX family protein [Listeria floridensis]